MEIRYRIDCTWVDPVTKENHWKTICYFRHKKDAEKFLSDLRESSVIMFHEDGRSFKTRTFVNYQYDMTEIFA